MKEDSLNETFTGEQRFRAKICVDGENLVLCDGRITGILTGPGSHDDLIREEFGERHQIDPGDDILAYYVTGIEYTSAQRKTADGQCIFFVFKPGIDHGDLEKQYELVVKPDTRFYYTQLGSRQYQCDTFANFTGIATNEDLASTTSTNTGHKIAGLNLLPSR